MTKLNELKDGDHISIKEFRKLRHHCGRRNLRLGADGTPLEEQEQRNFADYMQDLKIYWGKTLGRKLVWTHHPGGGKRPKGAAGSLKGQGVAPGPPDNFIYTPPPSCPEAKGTVIELKRQTSGVLSDDQKEWLEDLNEIGWVVACCHGAEKAIALVKDLGYDPRYIPKEGEGYEKI